MIKDRQSSFLYIVSEYWPFLAVGLLFNWSVCRSPVNMTFNQTPTVSATDSGTGWSVGWLKASCVNSAAASRCCVGVGPGHVWVLPRRCCLGHDEHLSFCLLKFSLNVFETDATSEYFSVTEHCGWGHGMPIDRDIWNFFDKQAEQKKCSQGVWTGLARISDHIWHV